MLNGFSRKRPSFSLSHGSITSTFAVSAYHHYSCEFESRSWPGVLKTTLCDKVCQWLTKDRLWFVLFFGYSRFLHQYHWPPWYNWHIVESYINSTTLYIIPSFWASSVSKSVIITILPLLRLFNLFYLFSFFEM